MKDFSLFDFLSWYLVFLFSLVIHEAAHAFAAWKLGDPTAHAGGQVSIDPTPHIRREPLGTVVIPLLTYFSQGWMIGWASAAYNRAWAAEFPKRAGLMAAAGPLANLIAFVAAFLAMKVGLATGVFTNVHVWSMEHVIGAGSSDWSYVAARLLSIIFSLNLILFVFNLLPVPPLDGSAMLKLALPKSAIPGYDRFLANPGLAFGGLLLAWWLFPKFGGDILRGAVHLLHG